MPQGNQYLALDCRFFDSPTSCAFSRTSAFALYLLLRRHVWRSHKKHNLHQVNQMHQNGYLVSAVSRATLAKMLDLKRSRISRLLNILTTKGVIVKSPTGRESVYVLGTWNSKNRFGKQRQVAENFFIDQPEVLENLSSEVSKNHPSEVSKNHPSEVSKKTHSNIEDNNKYNYSSDQELRHAVIHVRI